ncbi:hypothetical protein JCM19232_3161 [Vibrio ishigakensis]|uniref:Uncharacterized protein n=1 Tax=Vibrio ishigakensis TaxID=1481914 RepID=A0A0B8PNY4_9VIBR|nr:hypothetical protein JCM19232_3161 [Vibrio ishigakensis]
MNAFFHVPSSRIRRTFSKSACSGLAISFEVSDGNRSRFR